MDILKPELYWIRDKCYRKNPNRKDHKLIRPGQSQEFIEDQQPEIEKKEMSFNNRCSNSKSDQSFKSYSYMEDDMCDPDAPDEIDDHHYKLEKIDSGFKTYCTIPNSLFSVIVGRKGATKSRVEQETNTKIIVPKENEKGDIIIRGKREKDVITARRRLELIAFTTRSKRDATHFACFPLNFTNIIERVSLFKKQVLAECRDSNGLDETIFQEPEKIHLTLRVLVLLDNRERNGIAELLKNMKSEILGITGGKQLNVKIKGLEIMNDDVSRVNVLYAKCVTDDDLIQKVADFVYIRLNDSGFALDSRSKDNVKLHATLINTRYRKELSDNPQMGRGGWDSRDFVDATKIMEKFKDYDFGDCVINEISIAIRRTKSYSNGFYNTTSTITL